MILQKSKSALHLAVESGHTDISDITKGSMLGQVSHQQLTQPDLPIVPLSLFS